MKATGGAWHTIDWALEPIAAVDCDPCPVCEEPICPTCERHYAECPHPGPDSVPSKKEWAEMRRKVEGYARAMARHGAGVFVIVDGPGGPITVDSGAHESELATAAVLPRLGRRVRTWIAGALRRMIER